MADKRYSIDDILSEYPKTDNSGSKPDLEELLGSYGEKKPEQGFSTERVTLHNTDIFERPVAPELSDNKIESADDTAQQPGASIQKKPHTIKQSPPSRSKDEEEDSFMKKYSGLAEKLAKKAPADTPENEKSSVHTATGSFSEKVEQGGVYNGDKPASSPTGTRSFSEKMEKPADYGDNPPEPEKESLADRFKRLRGKDTAAPAAPADEIPPAAKPAKVSPFDKYESISKTDDTPEPSEPNNTVKTIDNPFASEKKEQSVDDILAEYSERSAAKKQREFTQHRSLTDFFTKILPDDAGNSGNTELLDGMIRMKKERISRTQHIAPIERKSISDIDLGLDDKIIPNTGQIPISKENAELEKLSALKERRNKKIKDFVLVGDEEETPDEELNDEPKEKSTLDDFEAFEDAPSISADITQLKNSLVIRLFMLLACFLVSTYIAIANDTGSLPVPDAFSKKADVDMFIFVNCIIGMLAAFVSSNIISGGVSKLVSFKADSDSLCAVSILSALLGNAVLYGNRYIAQYDIAHIHIATAICALLFNTAGKLLIIIRTQRSFKFVSGTSQKHILFNVENEDRAQIFTRGAIKDFPRLTAMKKTDFITDFLKTSYATDCTDKFCNLFVPIIIISSLIVGILSGLTIGFDGFYIGMSSFTGCISMCSLVSMMLVVNFPVELASRSAAESGGAIIGYNCIEEFADTNSVLIDAVQLFPPGSVKLAAIKVFSDTRIDEAIVEAASLTNQAGSILKNMFYEIIAGKTELLNPVESYIYEDSMGLCGWINNKRVLLGSRELMLNHSISGIPSIAKENEYLKGRMPVYLSISGELSAMFIIEMKPSLEVKHALESMSKQEIYTIIRSVDSLVTIRQLSELFDISPEYFKLIPFRLHQEFDDELSFSQKHTALAACSGHFGALASIVTGCKRLRGTISAGIALEAIAILLGILICLAMVILKSPGEISSTLTLTYNLIFTAVLVIFQLIRKN